MHVQCKSRRMVGQYFHSNTRCTHKYAQSTLKRYHARKQQAHQGRSLYNLIRPIYQNKMVFNQNTSCEKWAL